MAWERFSRKLEQLARFDLVTIDSMVDLLFNFVTKVYEKRSLIVTTNLSFTCWNEVFLDTTAAAVGIDHIVHHAVILKAKDHIYRLAEAKR